MTLSGKVATLDAIVRSVRGGRACSRKELSVLLSVRSSSISELVGDLVDGGIFLEHTLKPDGRGRPVIGLRYDPQRFCAVFVSVVDTVFFVRIVDSDLRIISESQEEPPADADADMITAMIIRLAQTLIMRAPKALTLSCLVFSLPGLLNIASLVWCYTSRWPSLENLKLSVIGRALGLPAYMVRNLDAELQGYHKTLSRMDGSILLLHWGHGIGASYLSEGRVVNGKRGRFCEIGHWELAQKQGLPCACGNTDCLETIAGLWALGPLLRADMPDFPQTEEALFRRISRLDLLGFPAMQNALQQVLRVTANLCRLLFPDIIVLSGPFVKNPDIYGQFVDAIRTAPLLKALDNITISTSTNSDKYELVGALSGPFEEHLTRSLSHL